MRSHPDSEGSTGLDTVTRYAPTALPQLLDIIEKSSNGWKKIAICNDAYQQRSLSGIKMVVTDAPDALQNY